MELQDGTTIGAAFSEAAARHTDSSFLRYAPTRDELSYAAVHARVATLIDAYRAAGYGDGHRVAMLLENRIEHVLHKLALNSIGVCCVPINPEYRASETAYLLGHSKPDLIVALGARETQITDALKESQHRPALLCVEPSALTSHTAPPIPKAPQAARSAAPEPGSPASILYTSGTTGKPKGCILSHGYELASGAWYAARGGMATFRQGGDRIYNPLPLYHVNSGVISLLGAMLTGNCQIQSERFSPSAWWKEVADGRATVVHYLGVIVPLLLNQPPSDDERRHGVRFALGAGVEPQLHARFEERFGFPLIELWGMTEMVRILSDHVAPRQVGTRAFGRAEPGVDVRVVDEADRDVPDGEPGEMLIRHSEATPRRGCFSGYLDDDAATQAAWRGGWFHTGDTVWRAADGMLHFVDRKKNIIRRSGENIAAAEVEALLLTHPDVQQAAVMAVKDEVREEEVLACIVLKREMPQQEAADSVFRFCYERLAYYKAPGWIHIVTSLPTTGTQKIQKHTIYPRDVDPRTLPGMFDLRARKRRG